MDHIHESDLIRDWRSMAQHEEAADSTWDEGRSELVHISYTQQPPQASEALSGEPRVASDYHCSW